MGCNNFWDKILVKIFSERMVQKKINSFSLLVGCNPNQNCTPWDLPLQSKNSSGRKGAQSRLEQKQEKRIKPALLPPTSHHDLDTVWAPQSCYQRQIMRSTSAKQAVIFSCSLIVRFMSEPVSVTAGKQRACQQHNIFAGIPLATIIYNQAPGHQAGPCLCNVCMIELCRSKGFNPLSIRVHVPFIPLSPRSLSPTLCSSKLQGFFQEPKLCIVSFCSEPHSSEVMLSWFRLIVIMPGNP